MVPKKYISEITKKVSLSGINIFLFLVKFIILVPNFSPTVKLLPEIKKKLLEDFFLVYNIKL